jgi:hypothetical protein
MHRHNENTRPELQMHVRAWKGEAQEMVDGKVDGDVPQNRATVKITIYANAPPQWPELPTPPPLKPSIGYGVPEQRVGSIDTWSGRIYKEGNWIER